MRDLSEVQVLAGPIRRRAIEATAGMPLPLQRGVGTILAHFAGPLKGVPDRAPLLDEVLSRERASVQGHARRAGYHQPGYMLRALRLALAFRLLDSGATIHETTYALGYSSPQSFCRACRELTGRTPAKRGDLRWESIVDAALAPIGQAELFAGARAAAPERVA